MHVSIHHYLVLAAVLFCLGLLGVIIQRNILIMLMCIEVLMNSINLTFIALARYYNQVDGHLVAIFVMAIAAVEAAIGLGIVISLFRNRQSIDINDFNSMRG
ncbi:MAG: NADH-quinone oxidoreductase subunit NuoK [Deltaproteobacteria bacterium]|nr:NADH-quinone oxidoreductase subunit NuoK [Deltaproteobacteria bacterium]